MDASFKERFSRDEIIALNRLSDVRGFFEVLVSWTLISGVFLLVGLWPNPLSVLLALVILGGRQLALNILMHDASHYTLFRTRWLNDFVGKYFCAIPVMQNLNRYRQHHLAHHKYSISDKDPDRSLVTPYPVSLKSLIRKFLRDLTGITGFKRLYGIWLMASGQVAYTVAAELKPLDQTGRGFRHKILAAGKELWCPLVFHSLMAIGFAMLGAFWIYTLWWVAYLTTFSLFIRIRSIAEHACLTESTDPRLSTRTTKAGPVARLTVAPHHVNYHLEHHLMMSVPSYHLPQFHRLLKERAIDLLPEQAFEPNYFSVLKRAIN